MRFERGKDPKEATGIGLSEKALKIGWVKFEIGVYNPERYVGLPGKVNNPLFNIKLQLNGDYIESAREFLKALNHKYTPLDDLMSYTERLRGKDRRDLKNYKKQGHRLFLIVESGTSVWDWDVRERGKLEYLKFHGEIYPISEGPHFLTYEKYEPWLKRISAKILGFLKNGPAGANRSVHLRPD
jgi:hypothetical protein